MAESTRFITIHRELLVIQHHLAEQLDLLDLIIRPHGQPLACLCLDAVDLGFDLRDFLQHFGRQRCSGLFRGKRIAAQRGNNDDSFKYDLRYQGATPSFGSDLAQMMTCRTAVNIDVFAIERKVAAKFGCSRSRSPARMPGISRSWWNPKNGYLRSTALCEVAAKWPGA